LGQTALPAILSTLSNPLSSVSFVTAVLSTFGAEATRVLNFAHSPATCLSQLLFNSSLIFRFTLFLEVIPIACVFIAVSTVFDNTPL